MIVEAKLQALGLQLPNLEEQYRANLSGARFLSHYAVQNLLYLSGTTPMRDGTPFNTGVVGQRLNAGARLRSGALCCSHQPGSE